MTTTSPNAVARLAGPLLFALAALLALTFPALAAETPDISAQNAFALQQAGDLIIVDVREDYEWRQTGIASSAVPLSLQDPKFLPGIMQLQLQNPDKQIAFICASSRRSGLVQAELEKRGFSNVLSIYGGMTGNGDAKGWIAEGLPTETWLGATN